MTIEHFEVGVTSEVGKAKSPSKVSSETQFPFVTMHMSLG